MSDPAAGSVDKSVQVKLVLLGMSLLPFPSLPYPNRSIFHSPLVQPGEAAVGKSSVVLRFVSRHLKLPSHSWTRHFLVFARYPTSSNPTKNPLLVLPS